MPIDVFPERGDPLGLLAHQLFWAAVLLAARPGRRWPAGAGGWWCRVAEPAGRQPSTRRIVASRHPQPAGLPGLVRAGPVSRRPRPEHRAVRHPRGLHPGQHAGRIHGGRGAADLRAGRHGVRAGRPLRRAGRGAARLHPHRRVRRDAAAPARHAAQLLSADVAAQRVGRRRASGWPCWLVAGPADLAWTPLRVAGRRDRAAGRGGRPRCALGGGQRASRSGWSTGARWPTR